MTFQRPGKVILGRSIEAPAGSTQVLSQVLSLTTTGGLIKLSGIFTSGGSWLSLAAVNGQAVGVLETTTGNIIPTIVHVHVSLNPSGLAPGTLSCCKIPLGSPPRSHWSYAHTKRQSLRSPMAPIGRRRSF